MGMNLILHITRLNKFSFNALLGAAETLPFFAELQVQIAPDEEKLLALLRAAAERPGETTVACFSFFSTQLREMAVLLGRIRPATGSRTLLVAGGPHPSGDPSGTLQLGFDLVVCGEGEETFPELLRCLHAGGDYRETAGLAYVDAEGCLRRTGRRPPISLDDHVPFSPRLSRFGPIEITRGCPFACGYCQTPQLHGARVRHRSLPVVLGHVETLCRRSLTDIRFITPNAFSYGSADGRILHLPALRELLAGVREIIGREGKIFFGSFPSEVRPEHVTPDTIALVREFADNDNLVFGAQSGSPRMLARCRRAHTIADVYRATGLTIGAGLKAYVDFILGLPGEEEEDIRLSLEMMQELAAMGAQVHAHTFMPLPLTPFARQPPGTVSPRLRRELELLIARGRAFGDWQRQEEQAQVMAHWGRC